MSNINVGSTVVLNSGGPQMTVTWINDGKAGCSWFAPGGEVRHDTFPVQALTVEE